MTNLTTQQSLLDYASIRLNFPNITDKGVSDYYGKGIELEEIKASMGPHFGSGTPEGNVTSNLSRLYVDTDTNAMYANPLSNVNTGWIELELINLSMGPHFGSGTPEGNVTSTISRLYVDTDTNTMYANPLSNVNTGWIAV